MVVPYANRTAVASLPDLALASKPATVKEVIEDFSKQCPHESVLESVQLIKGRTLRVIFPSFEVLEDIVTGGLAFRGHQIQFKTPSVYKWVTLLDLPHGIPVSEIKTALSKFGQVAHVRAEIYMGLYTGTRLVKIEMKTAIPSRVVVAGHPCTAFYRGQVRSCFRCGQAGHEAKKCPQRGPVQPTLPLSNATSPVVVPAAPSVVNMSTTPPTSPRTFAGVVSGQTNLPPPGSVSPVTLALPSSPIRALDKETPGMDTDVPSQKRPHSPVSESEGTDTDDGDRSKRRLGDCITTEANTSEPIIRDRSPHRTSAEGNDSSSDSSGKSQVASNASVIDPPAAQSVVNTELLHNQSQHSTTAEGNDSSSDSSGKSQVASNASVIVPPVAPSVVKTELQVQTARSLDRRPLSTRYQEFCPKAPEYTAEEAADLATSMLEVERQLASPTPYVNQEEIELQYDYDHLKLDFAIALKIYEAFDPDDPEADTPAATLKEADEALITFEAAYPEAVLASANLYGEVPKGTEPGATNTSTSEVLSEPLPVPESPVITDGQPLKTRRRSRHKSRSKTKELASCVRQRTTPVLPGVRKSRKSKQQPPESSYTPLVTDSGYLVTDTPSGTSPARPQRPDTGAAGAISPSPSSVNPSVE